MRNRIEEGIQKLRYYTGTPEGRNIVGKETAKNVMRTLGVLVAIGTIYNTIRIAEGEMGIECPESQSRDGTTYTVKPGDNFWGLNRNFGTDPDCVARENGIENQRLIHPGLKIVFPSECQTSNK